MGSKIKFLGIVLTGLVLLSGSGVRAGQKSQNQRQATQTVSINNSQKTALKGQQQSLTSASKKSGSPQDQNLLCKSPQNTSNVKAQKKPQRLQQVSTKKTSAVQDQAPVNAKSQTSNKPGKVQRPSRPGVRFVSNQQASQNVSNRQASQNVTDCQQGQTQLPSPQE